MQLWKSEEVRSNLIKMVKMMSEKIQNELKNIIDNSNMDKNEQTALWDIMQRVISYTDGKFSALEKKITTEDESDTSLPVYTILASKDSYRNFYPIIPNESNKRQTVGVFFKCTYEKFREICSLDNKAEDYRVRITINNKETETDIRFVVSDRYVKAEKRYLYRIHEQYGYDGPMIFSPYSRRYAEIVFDNDILVSDIQKINFTDEKLSGNIEASTLEKELMWNLEIDDRMYRTESFPFLPKSDDVFDEKIKKVFGAEKKSIIPGRVITNKKTYVCKKNEFLIFRGKNVERLVIKKYDDEIIALYDDGVKADPIIQIKVKDIGGNEYIEKNAFSNKINGRFLKKKKLLSYADIIYVLNAFKGNGLNIEINDNVICCNSIPDDKAAKIIYNYDDELRYYNNFSLLELRSEQDVSDENAKTRTLPRKRSVCCVIDFIAADKSKNKFAEDYVRFVIEFLNEKYPEFIWAGELKE